MSPCEQKSTLYKAMGKHFCQTEFGKFGSLINYGNYGLNAKLDLNEINKRARECRVVRKDVRSLLRNSNPTHIQMVFPFRIKKNEFSFRFFTI
ncbi:hypothetical protein ACOME3_001809 [Neoechinorhynchus agilis]